MSNRPTLTRTVAEQTIAAVNAANGNIAQAAEALGISRGTLNPRLKRAFQLYRLKPSERPERALADGTDLVMERLRQENTVLRQSNKKLREAQLSAELVREMVAGTRDVPDPPDWFIERDKTSNHGVPTLMVSDWHWGETVEPAQVNYVNAYNLEIADMRWRTMVSKTINLMLVHMAKPKYDYLCLPIIGDMLSGLIHEELRETNWATMAECLIQLRGRIIWMIDEFLDAFGKVHVIWMEGNHGRIDRKPRYKNAVYDNWEYVLGEQIRFHYEGTKALHFDLPASTEYLYEVCGTRYLAMHGDQWKGGTGIAGALSPMMIGRARKKESAMATNQVFDVIIHGHWHYHRNLGDVIGNGCFPAGTEVSTDDGVKPIEDVKAGDRVVAHDGSIQEVTNTFRKSSDDGLVHLKIRGIAFPMSATPNHLVWAIKGETQTSPSVGAKWRQLAGSGDRPQWIPAEFISPGDWVCIPRTRGTDEPIDEEDAWAYGLYLAEGATLLDAGSRGTVNRIVMTMHEREIKVLERFSDWFERRFGARGKTFLRKRQGVTSEYVVSPGRAVCAKFRDLFGHRAGGKHLPPGALMWSEHLCRAMLRGWIDGDGHTRADGVTHAVTVSKTLAYQMFRLALSADMRPSMSSLAAGGRRISRSYSVHFNRGQESIERDGMLFYRVACRFRDRNVTPVYDLEVSGPHTYTANLIGVHNSGKGYDEYAMKNNFQFQEPIQALWVTHPDYGITASWPIYLQKRGSTFR